MNLDREKWNYIKDEYEKAKACLWCPKYCHEWSRNDDDGYYHLWNAYHEARNAEAKDHLVYGRILYMMLTELDNNFDVSTTSGKFHKFAAPMKREYDLAVNENRFIPEQEFNNITSRYRVLKSNSESRTDSEEEYLYGISLIENNELLGDFQFHDSQIIYFQIEGKRCVLKLDYYGYVVTFEFLGVMGYKVDMPDIPCDYIYEFWCKDFKDQCDGSRYIFYDLGFMNVCCRSVRIIDVDKTAFKDPWKR